jgi:hypothetical protein
LVPGQPSKIRKLRPETGNRKAEKRESENYFNRETRELKTGNGCELETAKAPRREGPCGRPPLADGQAIQHSTFNIQHSTSNI